MPYHYRVTEDEKGLESLTLPQQNYLEGIADLIRESGRARVTDLAAKLQVRMPSVTESIKRLAAMGLVARRAWHEIVLTPRGRRIATQLDDRHRALREFMCGIMAMDADRANKLACRVEHCVDRRFAAQLARLAELLRKRHPEVLRDLGQRLRAASGSTGG